MLTHPRRAEPAQGSPPKKAAEQRAADLWCARTTPFVQNISTALRAVQLSDVFINKSINLPFRRCSLTSGRFCCSTEAFCAFYLPLNPCEGPRNVLWICMFLLRVFYFFISEILFWNHCHSTCSCFLINKENWSRFWCVSSLSYALWRSSSNPIIQLV